MPSKTPAPANNNVPPGLPAVKPPTARFILQLFLIPGFIVAGLILVFVIGSLAWVGTSNPESFLASLDSSNPDVRWRAAHELAQVIKRPESLELASNPDFALDIAVRLQKALAELEIAEEKANQDVDAVIKQTKAQANLTEDQKVQKVLSTSRAACAKLAQQQNIVFFLTSCLGDFTIPVGVRALDEIIRKDKAADMEGLSMRRTRAVAALANLGKNMQTSFFGKNVKPPTKVLTDAQKEVIRAKLIKASVGSENTERAQMADYAHGVLFRHEPSEVDIALHHCAKSEDIFLREVVANALNFWDGPLVEPTLLLLARDNGHGVLIRIIDD